jgi:beta-glucosidase
MLTSRRRIIPMLAGAVAAPLALRSGSVMAAESAFPDGFAWGASTSSYQIEGAVDVDGRGKSIWDIFCDTPGRVKNGDTGEIACDHYHRWPEDIELLARGGFNAYRFSTAWPRILPAGTGMVEARGLDFYDRLVDGLVARGITPWLCLYHWDLPQALQDKGGWVNRDIAEKFADYGRVVARRLGDRVKHWAMFNEPNVHVLFGYGMGGHAPGLTGLPNMLAAMHHQNLAQGRVLQALRAERGDFRLGTVISLQPTRPSPGHEADKTAVARFDAFWNGAFLDPLFKGFYPLAIAGDMAPLVVNGDLETIKQPVDFLGVNYYAPAYVADAPQSLFGAWFGAVPSGTRFTAMGWPIDAGGLTEILINLRDRYGDPELYVTENGACYNDPLGSDGTVHDEDRVTYLREHLAAASAALTAGVKLRGYFVWSLLDNFEWSEGYSRRFGIVHVDFKTLKRTPKASFAYLADVIRGHN